MGSEIQRYQYTNTIFDIPTCIIIGFSLTLFFCILYHILHTFFYWFVGTRIHYYYHHRDDIEEGTTTTTTTTLTTSVSSSLLSSNYSDDDAASHVAIFQALVHSNVQAWIMVGALMAESDHNNVNEDENRGERLRDLKKLPPLVKYRRQKDGLDHEDCAICLEEFRVGEFCQVFPVCNHVFHSDCIDCWFATKLTCPTCRCFVTD